MSMTMAEFHTLEGKRRGEAIGEVKASRRNLETILVTRFGEIPESVHERISRAKLNTLELWLKQDITAETIDEALRKA